MVKEFQVIEIEQEHFEPKSPFKFNDLKGLVNFCRVDRIRTCDLVVPNDARYRAALLPESSTFISWLACSVPIR